MTTESPRYREATDADRESIRRFHALTELWPDGEGELGEDFEEDDAKYVDEWSARDDGAIIAEIDGRVAGGAWLRHFTAENPGSGYISEEIPEVAIALEPDFTGRGMGKELMSAILDFARDRGAPAVSLTVDENNERAYRSYLGVGFEFTTGNAETEGYRTMVYRF